MNSRILKLREFLTNSNKTLCWSIQQTNTRKTTQWVGKIWWMWRNMERYFYNQTEWSLFSNKKYEQLHPLDDRHFPTIELSNRVYIVWCQAQNTHMFVFYHFPLETTRNRFLHIATQYSAKLRKQNNITNYKWKKLQSTLRNTPQLSLISNANTLKNTKVIGKKEKKNRVKINMETKKF